MPDSPTRDVIPCDSCGARIRWATTQANRRPQPVDAEQNDKGNLALWRDGAGRLWCRGLTRERPTLEGAEWQGMPHHATCTHPPRRRPRNGPKQRVGVRPAPQWRKP